MIHKMVRVFQETFVNDDLYKTDDPSTIHRICIIFSGMRPAGTTRLARKRERKIEMKRESLNTSIVLLHLQSGGWLAS